MSLDNSETPISATPLARLHNWQQHSYRYQSDRYQSNLNHSNVQQDVKKNSDDQPDGQAAIIDQNEAKQTLLVLEGVSSLAVEAAIAIVINGIHYAVLMASPSQLEYLALGFLFSEGLIEYRHELLDWEITALNTDIQSSNTQVRGYKDNQMAKSLAQQLQDYDAYLVELVLNQRCYQRIQAQKRQLAGRTGCGMCGMTGLTQALPDLSAYQQTLAPYPSLDTLLSIRAQIGAAQKAHQLTGALHAAATVADGQLQLFEDVGRHNALDKLIGWQLRHQAELNGVVMTSRLSIELVQKAIRVRTPWLAGMSAPTSTAVQVATRYGLGLAGFLRDNRVTFYTA